MTAESKEKFTKIVFVIAVLVALAGLIGGKSEYKI